MLQEFFHRENIFFFREIGISHLRIAKNHIWQKIETELKKAESVVVFLIPYFSGQKTTNLSVYAQVLDYHLYMRELSQRFADFLKEKGLDILSFGCADTSPLDERNAALQAGLGVLGENGLVLNEEYGSYIFIGAFFLSDAIAPLPPEEIKTCYGCGACKSACPTGAILDEKREKCLSLISQKKKWTPEEEQLMAKTFCKWGCDLCQTACPINQNAKITPISFFQKDWIEKLDDKVLDLPEEEFSHRAFSWRGREVLQRNLKK